MKTACLFVFVLLEGHISFAENVVNCTVKVSGSFLLVFLPCLVPSLQVISNPVHPNSWKLGGSGHRSLTLLFCLYLYILFEIKARSFPLFHKGYTSIEKKQRQAPVVLGTCINLHY